MNTLIYIVRWPILMMAATCFGLWAYFVNKSGLRWPLAPAVFCFTQGLFAFPILIYHWRKIKGIPGDIPGALLAGFASLLVLYAMHRYGKKQEPRLHMNWAFLAGTLGFIGLTCFTHELARLAELKGTGDRMIGITIASTIALETIVAILYHFWDIRKTGVRMNFVDVFAVLGIITCIFCLYRPRHAPSRVSTLIDKAIKHEKSMVSR